MASVTRARVTLSSSPGQTEILRAFERFHRRHQRLPSSADAQASSRSRDPDVPSYAEVMAAFPGRRWADIREWAATELGLDVTQASRRAAPVPASAPVPPEKSTPPEGPLSDAQFELLWEVSREPRLIDHLDGRTMRALVSRGLARRDGDWLRGTDTGPLVLHSHLQALAAAARGRTASIYRALLNLEVSIIPGSEVRLGAAIVPADDVVLGLFRKARAFDVEHRRS